MTMAILERINHFFRRREGGITLKQLIERGTVCLLHASNRSEALYQLAEALKKAGEIENSKRFYQEIIKREGIVSTGIGMGVAIPHAKLENYDHFFLAIGVQKAKKGIEWDALDGVPIRLIFMIGGPADRQTEYLQILSHLTATIKDEELRKGFLACSSNKELISLFKNC